MKNFLLLFKKKVECPRCKLKFHGDKIPASFPGPDIKGWPRDDKGKPLLKSVQYCCSDCRKEAI